MKRTTFFAPVLPIVLLGLVAGCSQPGTKMLFTKLSAQQTGIGFVNTIHDKDSSYSFINEFGYMGGGVGIGDFNNDGLKDVFFTGNQVSSKLYINKGNNQFTDITKQAGVGTDVWCTGVSVADVNNDGYDDIYVCVFGKDLVQHQQNLLFINQHNLTFTEQAAAYGLADTGNSTQAAFFDYDKDGDLDMYLANYFLSENNANSIFPKDKSGRSPANDKLFRNDSAAAGSTHPVFTDVTIDAGIREDGYGLGVSVSDLNSDGWPDIYVANDFISNDELWLNNRNGTFTNVIAGAVQHQSYSSMGADAADINNDALPDVITLDMLPETNERKKTSFSFMNYERYESERSMGYEPEFVRNMLQLNNGVYKKQDTAIPYFSEIGQYAGINATDWSWSVLMADFDNDCWKDIHITNGIGRDFINGDFLSFSGGVFSSMMTREEKRKAIRSKLAELDHVNLPNYLYRNNHNYTFDDVSAAAGVDDASMSNGAAYADLDNDGDLDLLVNNINQEAFVLSNTTNTPNAAPAAHFLKIRLAGTAVNTKGTGTKIILYTGGMVQMQEQYPVRGYFSSVDQDMLFGMGSHHMADSLLVTWPGGEKKILRNVKADTTLVLHAADGAVPALPAVQPAATVFTPANERFNIAYKHTDVPFNDYNEQRLLPQKFSQQGPPVSVGDVNGDGLNDFFIGGGFNFSGSLFTGNAGGLFSSTQQIGDSTKWQEETGSLLFDADNDNDLDLVLVYGDSRHADSSSSLIPALYQNAGAGKFIKIPGAFADSIRTIASCVTAGDYDGDGDMDLFIGGRVSKKYPLPPRSYLLRNDKGRFTDVTAAVCAPLIKPGMVTAATWVDYDNDTKTDLVIAGEWMPLRFFRNTGAVLTETTAALNTRDDYGMWRCITASDIDNDGDMDFIAGNLGYNCDYHCSAATPLELFAADLDKNGSIDPVPFYYIKTAAGTRQSYPGISLSMFGSQVPPVFKKYLFYKDYAKADYENIFGKIPGKDITKLHCSETGSCVFENTGKGNFVKQLLPAEVQFAPVNAVLCSDFDGDGIKDILLAGNEYQAEVITGRYDASYGYFLKGTGANKFTAVTAAASGFFVNGDVRSLSLLPLRNGERLILAAVNNGMLQVFSTGKKIK